MKTLFAASVGLAALALAAPALADGCPANLDCWGGKPAARAKPQAKSKPTVRPARAPAKPAAVRPAATAAHGATPQSWGAGHDDGYGAQADAAPYDGADSDAGYADAGYPQDYDVSGGYAGDDYDAGYAQGGYGYGQSGQEYGGSAPAAPGYGVSHGAGYGYVGGGGSAHAGYARSSGSVDVRTSYYDSGWVERPIGPPMVGYGHGYGAAQSGVVTSHHDTGWRAGGDRAVIVHGVRGGYDLDRGHGYAEHGPALPAHPIARHCPHPGAVVCFPAVHSDPVAYVPAPSVQVSPDTFYGVSAGGVGGEMSYGGGYGWGGGGTVVIQSGAQSSAFASARAAAFASARVKGRPAGGHHGGGKPCCGGKGGGH